MLLFLVCKQTAPLAVLSRELWITVKLKIIESALLLLCSEQRRLMDLITVNKSFKNPKKQWSIRNLKSSQLHPSHPLCKLQKNPKQPKPKTEKQILYQQSDNCFWKGKIDKVSFPLAIGRHIIISQNISQSSAGIAPVGKQTNDNSLPWLEGCSRNLSLKNFL